MQTIRWYRWLAVGAMVVPIAARAQGPQAVVTPIVTLPGLMVAEAAKLPNSRTVILGIGDSLVAFNPLTRRSTLIVRNWDYNLAVSPRGDRVAYARDNGSGDDYVWSIPIDPTTGAPRGAAQRVSSKSADTPSFAPTGNLIAFSIIRAHHDNDIAVVASTGGPERVLATVNRSIQQTYWSADGKWVYAELGGPQDSARRAIARVSANGGPLEEVLVPVPGANTEGSLQGQIVFYRPDIDARADGRLAFLTSGGAHGNVQIPPGAVPAFSDQGSTSLLTTQTRVGELHLVDIASGKARIVAAPSVVPNTIRWSLDGRRVAAILSDGMLRRRGGVIVMNADGSGQRTYNVPATGGIQFSPRGDLVALGDRSASTIAILDLATGQLRSVKGPEMQMLSMHWRSDGKAIFAEARFPMAGTTTRHLGVTTIGLDGRVLSMRDVTAEYPNATRAAPFNDTLMLVFGGPDMSPRFAVVPLTSGKAYPIDFPPLNGGTTSRPSGGHDGTPLIELVTSSAGTAAANLYSPTGRFARQVPLAITHPESPVLPFPDGEHGLVAGRTPSDTALRYYVTDFKGGPPRLLAGVPRAATTFSLSPDGKSLIYILPVDKETRIDAIDFSPVLRAAGIH